MEWLSQYSASITALTSIATLFVWVFYAQILYRNFARTRRPRIIINRGHGNDTSAYCLISNMSSEPIFVQEILTTLGTSSGDFVEDMIDYEAKPDADAKGDIRLWSRQGPVSSGGFHHIDTFDDIIERICRANGLKLRSDDEADGVELEYLDIRVVAIYGSEDQTIGARRRFSLRTDDRGQRILTPTSLDTKRYANLYRRWRVRRWMKALDDA